MNDEQALRLRLYDEAVARGAAAPIEEAKKAYAFIAAGVGTRKPKKKSDEPETIPMFPDALPYAAVKESMSDAHAIMRAAGINPPQIEESRVEIVGDPVHAPRMSDEELKADALKRTAGSAPIDPATGLIGVPV